MTWLQRIHVSLMCLQTIQVYWYDWREVRSHWVITENPGLLIWLERIQVSMMWLQRIRVSLIWLQRIQVSLMSLHTSHASLLWLQTIRASVVWLQTIRASLVWLQTIRASLVWLQTIRASMVWLQRMNVFLSVSVSRNAAFPHYVAPLGPQPFNRFLPYGALGSSRDEALWCFRYAALFWAKQSIH